MANEISEKYYIIGV